MNEPSTSEPTSSSGSSSNTSKPKPRGFTDSLVDPFFKSDTTFDSFRFLKTLGCGTFGKVKLAEYVQTRRKVLFFFLGFCWKNEHVYESILFIH
ncbi:hypothetical protein HMI55_004470 [Coelomomyces lativittatus]|nr:hypothetical protein HMI55_004470 [Coelomomyces lativittatus]